VRWIYVPSSLLAMVDASIGGKTAINFGGDKNVIGAFHQPAAVFCDLELLASLPEREYRSGLAEAVKTAALASESALAAMESSADALLVREPAAVAACVEACVQFKAAVVAEDETESLGIRTALNFGHTLGHALEALFPGRWLHGEAVAIGIAAALRVSMRYAGLAAADAQRVSSLLRRFELPLDVPQDVELQALRSAILADKKRKGDRVRLVVLSSPGSPSLLGWKLDDDLLKLLTGRA
jgi:3-dehydroquinate synthase